MVPEFFFRELLLCEQDSGLVSMRLARYGLVSLFSIPVFSPSDKRGKSCSRNRGLGIAIGAENERFHEI